MLFYASLKVTSKPAAVADSALSQTAVKHRQLPVQSLTLLWIFGHAAQNRTVVYLGLFKSQSVLCTGCVGASSHCFTVVCGCC